MHETKRHINKAVESLFAIVLACALLLASTTYGTAEEVPGDEKESIEKRTEYTEATEGVVPVADESVDELADDDINATGNFDDTRLLAPTVDGLEGERDLASTSTFALAADEQEISLMSTSTVTTLAQFREAVTAADVDTIILGANITMTAIITIPTSKTSLTIDGAGQYTLTQNGAFYLYSTATNGAVYTFQNMTFTGRSYYGIANCGGTTNAPTIVVRDVTYTGPQLAYNRYGTLRFEGTNNITIQQNGAASNTAEEVAEVHAVSVAGNLTVTSTSTGFSFFWMFNSGGTNPQFTIEEGAHATFQTSVNTAYAFFYVDVTPGITFDVKANANLLIDISGYNSLSYLTGQRITTMTIGQNATAVFNFAGGVNLANGLVVEQGATLRMNYKNRPGSSGSAYTYPLFYLTRSAGTIPVISLNDPKAVVFTIEPTNRAFFNTTYANPIVISTTDFNYWASYTSAAAQDKPTAMWSSAEKNAFEATINLRAGSDSLSSITSSDADFAANFAPGNARVIQVGTDPMPLVPDQQWDYMDQTLGEASTNAKIYADYTATDQAVRSYSGYADATSRYAIDIEAGSTDTSTIIGLTSVLDFIAVRAKTSVLESGAPSADAVLQIIEQHSQFTDDAFSLITNIDAGSGGSVTAEIIASPDTSLVGPATATVRLANDSGKSIQIAVPIFITDRYTTINDERTYALRAEDFTVYKSEFPESDIEGFILEKSHAQAWNIVSGADITSQITMPADPLQNILDTQSILLSVQNVERLVMVTVIDEVEWVDVRIPTTMLFGTLDVYENGGIISPQYEIENRSQYPVDIELAGFNVIKSDGITLIDATTVNPGEGDMQLSLALDGTIEVEYLVPFTNAFQRAGILTTLGAGSTSSVTLSGTYYGAFTPGMTLKPEYSLVWSFTPRLGG